MRLHLALSVRTPLAFAYAYVPGIAQKWRSTHNNMGAMCSSMPCCASSSNVAREAIGSGKGGGEARELSAEAESREGGGTSHDTRELEEFESDFKRDVSTLGWCVVRCVQRRW